MWLDLKRLYHWKNFILFLKIANIWWNCITKKPWDSVFNHSVDEKYMKNIHETDETRWWSIRTDLSSSQTPDNELSSKGSSNSLLVVKYRSHLHGSSQGQHLGSSDVMLAQVEDDEVSVAVEWVLNRRQIDSGVDIQGEYWVGCVQTPCQENT